MPTTTRALARLLITAAFAFALVGLPRSAGAVTSPLTAVDGAFTGTAGNDTLVIGAGLDYLTHNRFDAGDPGFASDADFDSFEPGVQLKTRGLAANVSFDALGGDDVLSVGGMVDDLVFKAFDLGPGTDQINATAMAGPIQLGTVPAHHMESVEKVLGGNYPDTIKGFAGGAARTAPFAVFAGGGADVVEGTDGPDRLDGAGGHNTITGLSGDDVLYVAAPFPPNEKYLDGGNGNDALVVSGSTGSDDLALYGWEGEFWAWDLADEDGGYHALGVERAQLNLLSGDDVAVIMASLRTVVAAGGTGRDHVILEALGSTASVETVTTGKRVTIPWAFGNTPVPPTVVRLDKNVEQTIVTNETTIATAPGPGGGPHVRSFRADGTPLASFFAYDPSFTGGVNLAMGDVNGDGEDDIVTAPMPGGGPHVRVFAADGSDTGLGFFAEDPSFTGGINLATADVDGDGVDEIITARATNAPVPWIRIWTPEGVLLAQWPATGFGTTGVEVARGPYTDVGEAIIVSSAAGAPSRVAVFAGNGGQLNVPTHSPYGTFGGGVSASRGQFPNSQGAAAVDAYDEIVTGAGPGGGPLVRIVERSASGTEMNTLKAFYAYSSSFAGGVEVATCNADGGADEIVTAPGAGASPLIRTFNSDGTIKRKSFLAYDAGFKNGVHVACGKSMFRSV